MIRVVVDTSVFVSALIGRRGAAPDRVLRAWIDDHIEVVVSRQLLEELEAVLRRPKFASYVDPATVTEFIERVRRHAALFADPPDPAAVVRDAGDDYLVALSAAAEVDFLITGDSDLLDAPDLAGKVLTPRQLLEELAADAIARHEPWELRSTWSHAFGLLGAYGYRPKLAPDGLIAYRADGSTVIVKGASGVLPTWPFDEPLSIELRARDKRVIDRSDLVTEDLDVIVDAVSSLFGRHAEGEPPEDAFIRHFPPRGPRDQILLGAAYAQYRYVLDALAARGIHGYVEFSGFGHRIYSDITDTLMIDISIGDEALPVFDDDDAEWVVFFDAPGGYLAEFTVVRDPDPIEDADVLAGAVADALTDVLLGGHIFLERYDPEVGRLAPEWLQRRPPE